MGETRVMTEVFFGRGIGSKGGLVPRTAWDSFLAEVVEPRLRTIELGFTAHEAHGLWTNPTNGKTVKEQSFVLKIINKGTRQEGQVIRDICRAYIRWFKQRSVYRTHARIDWREIDRTVRPAKSSSFTQGECHQQVNFAFAAEGAQSRNRSHPKRGRSQPRP